MNIKLFMQIIVPIGIVLGGAAAGNANEIRVVDKDTGHGVQSDLKLTIQEKYVGKVPWRTDINGVHTTPNICSPKKFIEARPLDLDYYLEGSTAAPCGRPVITLSVTSKVVMKRLQDNKIVAAKWKDWRAVYVISVEQRSRIIDFDHITATKLELEADTALQRAVKANPKMALILKSYKVKGIFGFKGPPKYSPKAFLDPRVMHFFAQKKVEHYVFRSPLENFRSGSMSPILVVPNGRANGLFLPGALWRYRLPKGMPIIPSVDDSIINRIRNSRPGVRILRPSDLIPPSKR